MGEPRERHTRKLQAIVRGWNRLSGIGQEKEQEKPRTPLAVSAL